MILTTHSIVGSALAKVATANPVLAFAIGMSSHYILDSLPHWEYHLGSATHDPNNRLNDDMVIGKNFVFDLIKIGFDFSLGLALSLLFFYDSNKMAIGLAHIGWRGLAKGMRRDMMVKETADSLAKAWKAAGLATAGRSMASARG